MTKLEKWQGLCREVDIEVTPPSITNCKKVSSCSGPWDQLLILIKALAGVYVNIFSIIDHRDNPDRYDVVVFPNYKQFRKYTLDGRIYPLNRAKQDTFIKALLRPLHF
jgi:hypothetical protein